MKPLNMLTASLVVAMLLSTVLAGCSNGSNSKQTADEPAQTGKEGENKTVSFPLADTLTLKMVAVPHQNVKKDYNEMSFFKEMETKTNVHMDWKMLTSDTAKEKMNLIFATNDLPDAFFGPETTDHVTTDISRQLIPLNDLIDQYAPNFKKILDSDASLKAYLTSDDGNIYSLPMMDENPANNLNNAMFINKKWLDQLGLSIPTTIEEFENVLKAFKERDPNGNGKADEIPYSFRMRDGIQGADPLAAMFGKVLPNSGVIQEDGKIVYAPTLKENEQFYIWLNKLNKASLLDPEIFTQDANVYVAKLRSETSIVGVLNAWTELWAFGADSPDYVPLPPLKGPTGAQGWNIGETQISTKSFAITTANKHPEETIAWADQFYDPDTSVSAGYGTIGVVYKKEGDKYVRNPVPDGFDATSFLFDNSPGYYSPRWVPADLFKKIDPNDNLVEKFKLMEIYKPFVKSSAIRNPLFNQQDKERITKWSQDVEAKNAFYDKYLAKMVTGNNPEKDWEEMVAGLKKLGLDEVIALYQSYYDKMSQ